MIYRSPPCPTIARTPVCLPRTISVNAATSSPFAATPASPGWIIRLSLKKFCGSLKQYAARHNFLLHAFCVMPDHLHFLAEGTQPASDVREFVRLFKQHTAFEFRKTSSGRLWEKSYYDYVLRPSDSIEAVACYIWWNPVRGKLCARPEAFSLSGSQTIPWMKCASAGTSWSAPWKTSEPA